MAGILRGEVYCPFSENVQHAFIPEKVSKATLTEQICLAMAKRSIKKRILGWTEETYPDR